MHAYIHSYIDVCHKSMHLWECVCVASASEYVKNFCRHCRHCNGAFCVRLLLLLLLYLLLVLFFFMPWLIFICSRLFLLFAAAAWSNSLHSEVFAYIHTSIYVCICTNIYRTVYKYTYMHKCSATWGNVYGCMEPVPAELSRMTMWNTNVVSTARSLSCDFAYDEITHLGPSSRTGLGSL